MKFMYFRRVKAICDKYAKLNDETGHSNGKQDNKNRPTNVHYRRVAKTQVVNEEDWLSFNITPTLLGMARSPPEMNSLVLLAPSLYLLNLIYYVAGFK